MTRPRPEPRHLLLAFAVFAMAAHAQEGRPGGGTSIRPRLSLSQSWTDNLNLAQHDKDAALITTVAPGISMSSSSGAVRGTLDYSLNGVAYLKSNQGSQLQNSLTANGQAEIVPGVFFVDAQASIGQQSVSAFGLQAPPTLDAQGGISPLTNPNRRETGTLSVTPSLRGQIGSLVNVDLRGTGTITEARGSSLGDSRTAGLSLSLSQRNPGVLSWYTVASVQRGSDAVGPSNRSSSVTGGLNYRPDPDWNFSANAGYEGNDYLSGGSDTKKGLAGGITADWTPTPRTRLNGSWQKHNYGDSHNLSVDHRMAHSVWQLVDSSSTTLGNAGGGVRTNYQLYYELLASQYPDPILRDQAVRAYLQLIGLSPDALSSTGFLSSGPSRTHSQLFSVALQGVRSSVTATLNRTLTNRLSGGLNQGDLATNSRIEQRSYSLSGSYQLSPVSSFAMTASRQETSGDSNTPRSQLTSLSANWNSRVNLRLSVQMGARHTRFEGVTSYDENAAYANLTQQF